MSQAVALAFLHLSLGRQKATSGTFSTDGFGWLGLNPAGVSLFRMHVERCPSGPLSSIQARRKLLVVVFLHCSKKTISNLIARLPVQDLSVSALRRWTIHKHPPLEVTGPRSRPDVPQRCFSGCLVGCVLHFVEFSRRKEREP